MHDRTLGILLRERDAQLPGKGYPQQTNREKKWVR